MKKLNGIFIFMSGAVVGAAVSYFFTKNKIEREKNEEIKSVIEVFSRKERIAYDKGVKDTEKVVQKELVEHLGYAEETKEEIDMGERPYIISPKEFGEKNYDVYGFSLFADDILANDYDEIIEDVEDMLGVDVDVLREHFGEYEDDVVLIRNDDLERDYEITLNDKTYSEVVG